MRRTSDKSILDIEIQLPFVKSADDKTVSFLLVSESSGKPSQENRPDMSGNGDNLKNKGKPMPQGAMPPKESEMQNHEGRPEDMNTNSSSETEILLNINFKE